MKVKFWGVRGSVPTPDRNKMKYGGNTSCVEVLSDNGDTIILDGGTGLRNLGNDLNMRSATVPVNATFFISHVHWDHINGIPFFSPFFNPANSFSFYGALKADGRLEESLNGQMSQLFFPVRLRDYSAKMVFHEIIEEEVQIGSLKITAKHINHPQGNFGYKITENNVSVCYCCDCEYTLDSVSEEFLEFIKDVDVLICDGQYSREEYYDTKLPRKGWGHSCYEDTMLIAKKAGVKKVYLFHHDPDHDDHYLDIVQENCRDFFDNAFLAKEGEVIYIKDKSAVKEAVLEDPTKSRERIILPASAICIDYENDYQNAVITLPENLSLFDIRSVRTEIIKKISSKTKTVKMDLKAVQRMNSFEVGMVVEVIGYCFEHKIEISLVNCCEKLRYIFEITRIDKLVEIYNF